MFKNQTQKVSLDSEINIEKCLNVTPYYTCAIINNSYLCYNKSKTKITLKTENFLNTEAGCWEYKDNKLFFSQAGSTPEVKLDSGFSSATN